ncbi:hypothetical protein EHS25_009558 [Saitozyma podzolica]|uniref:Uncharacterized protein n=1 Tax=Saitozyma podzolica TaxID=1890683 RepID=A0A427YJL6_9TREE|nr:hypothetical protein EHS25_009558 [Saitozyma podzolica]
MEYTTIAAKNAIPGLDALPTPKDLEEARSHDVVDQDGKEVKLGDLIAGKKAVLIFVRHWFIIIGPGGSVPIPAYIETTGSPYSIYGNPSLSLYRLFGFKSNLAGSKKGEEKEYEKALGGMVVRTWSALKKGPFKHLEHASQVGPKDQNGGEMVLEADGSCIFMHRMQHSADHTEIAELAETLGIQPLPISDGRSKPSSRDSSRKSSVDGRGTSRVGTPSNLTAATGSATTGAHQQGTTEAQSAAAP